MNELKAKLTALDPKKKGSSDISRDATLMKSEKS